MARGRLGACVLLAAVLTLSMPPSVAAKKLLSDGALEAHTTSQDWCREKVYVEVQSPDRSPFTGDKAAMRRMVAKLRDLMEERCPQAKSLILLGVVSDQVVYGDVADLTAPAATETDESVPDSRPSPPGPAEVREAQSLLTDLGFRPGPIDGAMGPKTRDAIAQFLSAQGVDAPAEVNGDLIALLRQEAERSGSAGKQQGTQTTAVDQSPSGQDAPRSSSSTALKARFPGTLLHESEELAVFSRPKAQDPCFFREALYEGESDSVWAKIDLVFKGGEEVTIRPEDVSPGGSYRRVLDEEVFPAVEAFCPGANVIHIDNYIGDYKIGSYDSVIYHTTDQSAGTERPLVRVQISVQDGEVYSHIWDTLDSGDFSIAKLRRQQEEWEQGADDRAAEAKRRHEEERQAAIDALIAEAQGAIDAGTVYRSLSYWIRFGSPLFLQNVFLGKSDKVYTDTNQFRYYFGAYVAQYSKNCRHLLPDTVPVYTIESKTQTFNGWTGVVTDTTNYKRTIYVKPNLFPKYKEYLDRPISKKEAANTFISILKGQPPQNVGVIEGLFEDMDLLLTERGCESATARQFEENLLRLANGEPTLQESGERVAGAILESRKPEDIPNPTDLWGACLLHLGYDSWSSWDSCACIGNVFPHVLTPEELRRYINDFDFFWGTVLFGNYKDPGYSRQLSENYHFACNKD